MVKATIKFVSVVCFLLLAFSGELFAGEARSCSEPVDTTEGPVTGLRVDGSAACAWKGLPFAAPPVGDLRWRAPLMPVKRAKVFEAYEVGFACPQSESLTSGGEARGFSEDCLTLNVWSPAGSGNFPVMFFIHGGGFRQGTGTYGMYDGARLAAEREVVVVTINYRIGSLGYLALPELGDEDPDNGSGNYGILDQIRALEWVRDNIEGFGGDPGSVTIFGQSAGGMSVSYLLVSPRAAGLFHRAINMSGPFDMVGELDQAYRTGEQLAQNLGCEGAGRLQCLRSKPTEAFVGSSGNLMFEGGLSYMPVIDGKLIPDQPLALIEAGSYNRVPVMVGNTRDEIKLYTMMFSGLGLWSRSTTKGVLRWLSGDKADEILALYDFEDYRRPADMLVTIIGDAAIGSRGFAMAEALSGRSPVWFYRFDWDETRFPNKMGAFHGLDLPLVFGALNLDSQLGKLLANKKAIESGEPLSEQMMSYYANFARKGDPNGEGLPRWSEYDTEDRVRMYFDRPIKVVPMSEKEIDQYRYFASQRLDRIFAKFFKFTSH